MAFINFQPKDYFNTKLFTANASTQSITGVGFQPDMVWGKSRGNAYDHEVYDAVRGVYKRIKTNQIHAEVSDTGNLTSFDSDGFSLGSATNMNYSNGDNIVSWNWKANGQGSSNTDGSINTTYTSANTTSGFSIVKYTGTGSNATVGHGLGAVPKMIIVKCLDQTHWWFVYHSAVGNTKKLNLNTTNDSGSASANYWNNTTPTSSVFSVGTETSVNQSGQDYIAYCFSQKSGFSSMGSYVGNGSNDGAFCYTGFKPGFIMIKSSTTAMYWHIFDDKRQGFNPNNYRLNPNANEVETTTTGVIDFLSNGFKIRTNQQQFGTSGATYIWMAFAEEPLVSSNGVAATAR